MWPLLGLAVATVALVIGGMFIEHDLQRGIRESYDHGVAAGQAQVELSVYAAQQKQAAQFSVVQEAGNRAVSDLEAKDARLEKQLAIVTARAGGGTDCLDPSRVRDLNGIGSPDDRGVSTVRSRRPVKAVRGSH